MSLTEYGEGLPLLDQEKLTAPPDRYLLAYIIFVLQGLGILLPFNAFISATDYFSDLYGASFVFFISPAFNWSGALCFALLMKTLPRFSFVSRALSSTALFFVVLLIIPFLSGTAGLPVTLVGIFLTGLASAVLQSTVAGLAALFPPEYMGGMMSGCGVAGVVAIALRAITKVSMPQTDAGQEASGKLFFILAACVEIVCAVSFIILWKLPITKHYITNCKRVKDLEARDSGAKQANLSEIIRKVWKEALVIVTTLFITLSLFPGITGLVTSNNNAINADWFSIMYIAVFMIGDVVGRTLPRWVRIFSHKVLLFPSMLRLLFFPLFIFCIRPRLIASDWVACIIMGTFALSNGYISTLGMIYGPQQVAAHEKELTGIILSGCLTAGIFVGSHFAFLMLYLVTGSIGIKF